ncbi:hypothetical protein BT69DRAFT_1356189 [Atractiella rhizophila]|nr:hypothetical protein BT69DRAFT_1356189 [Atractiella rhizophila]
MTISKLVRKSHASSPASSPQLNGGSGPSRLSLSLPHSNSHSQTGSTNTPDTSTSSTANPILSRNSTQLSSISYNPNSSLLRPSISGSVVGAEGQASPRNSQSSMIQEEQTRKGGLWRLRDEHPDVVLSGEEEDMINELESFTFESFKDGSFNLSSIELDDKKRYPYWWGLGSATSDWSATLMSLRMPDLSFTAAHLPVPSTAQKRNTMKSLTTTASIVSGDRSSLDSSTKLETPKKVLDIGCGPYLTWIIECAFLPGWEETSFVGMDVAPSLYPLELLTKKMGERIAFLPGNFLEPWPWATGEFDLIHFGNIGSSIPEDKWHDVIEEAARCLSPKGIIEIWDAHILSPRFTSTSIATGTTSLPKEGGEPVLPSYADTILKTHATASDTNKSNFLNPYPLTLIPPLIPLYISSRAKSTGVIPLPPSSLPPQPLEEEDVEFPELVEPLQVEENARILGIVKSRMDASIARSMRVQTGVERKKLEDALETYQQDVAYDASLSSLLHEKMDWRCSFDYALIDILEEKLPVLEEKLEGMQPEQKGRYQLQRWVEDGRVELGRGKRRVGKWESAQGGEERKVVEVGGWASRKA